MTVSPDGDYLTYTGYYVTPHTHTRPDGTHIGWITCQHCRRTWQHRQLADADSEYAYQHVTATTSWAALAHAKTCTSPTNLEIT